MKKLTVSFLILAFLLCFQMVFSFVYPSCGFNDSWQPVENYLPKFDVESSDNFFLSKIYPLISENYRLNSDIGHYLEIGRNFSAEYFNGSPFLERPLYSFLIFLPASLVGAFIPASYGAVFGIAMLLNLILASAGLFLFFLLVRNLFSERIAWLSSILLIFSPFVHGYLNQPLAEILMLFGVSLSAYLIYRYIKNPSWKKLIFFSLIIGIFLLGKMFFATSFFVLILAIWHKRLKEGAAFLAIHLLPMAFWYLWVTKVWGLAYYSHGVQHWNAGIWVLDIFRWPWQETYQALINIVPNFLSAIIFSFLLIPVVFSIIGFHKIASKSRNIFYLGPIFSVFLLGFLISFYYFRHVFLLFPVIYPTAVLGIEWAADYLRGIRPWLAPVFYVIIISLIIFISNINIYQVFNYNN